MYTPDPPTHEPHSAGPAHTAPRRAQAVDPRSTRQPVTAVLLDLDGTLTDSAPVIIAAIAHTLESFGLPAGSAAERMRFVGPPLSQGFAELAGLTGADNTEAVRRYRAWYREHMHEAPVYDGIVEALARLQDAGVPLCLATSKNEDYAVDILTNNGLARFLVATAGADPADQRGSKAEVVALALDRLAAAGVDTSRVLHVGDRHHDVEGAHAQGLECIGVTWGYGSREELSQAQWLVDTPAELTDLVLSLVGGAGAPVTQAGGAGAPVTQAAEEAEPEDLAEPRSLVPTLEKAKALLAQRIEQADAQRQAEREAALRLEQHERLTGPSGSSPTTVLDALPRWLVRSGLTAWLLVGLAIVVAMVLFAVSRVVPVFVGVFIALVVTSILHPLQQRFTRLMPRYPAAFLSLATAFACVAALVAYVVSSVSSQWPTLASQFSTGVDTILDFAEHGPLPVHMSQEQLTDIATRLVEQGQHYIESNATSLAGEIVSNAGTVVNVFVVLALALFAAVFFLASGGQMWRWFVNELPAHMRGDVHRAAGAGWYTFAGYARGTVILALTDALMAGVFLQLVGVPLAAPLAVLVFIGAFIPIIGAPSAMLVAMMVALASKGFLTMVVVGLGVAGIGQIEGHVLQPLIMGRQVRLHPVVVLLAVAIGTFSAGLLGAVVAVPLVSVAWSIYSALHVRPASTTAP